ncbi:MAG: hypothetical protein J5517_10360 [Eubacterium sp.]|nr:hypothetical protein [Eubacterium sp.]
MRLFKDLFISLKEIVSEYLKSRVFPVTLLIIVLFILLIDKLFTIQIEQGEVYTESFEVKSEKTLTVSSIRGNIYDVNGRLLAYNNISYTLTFGNSTALPDEAKHLGLSESQLKNRIINNTLNILKQNGDDLDATMNIRYKDGKYYYNIEGETLRYFLKDVYSVNTVDDLTPEMEEATAEESAKYLMDLFEIGNEYDDETAYKILCCRYNLWLNRFQQYVPVEVAHNISDRSRSAITENKDNLLGMDIQVTSSRVYNDAKYFSHIIGYVGRASQDDIDELNEQLGENKYDSNDVVGKAGIEKVYETDLHGTDGEQTLYVDNLGKVLEVTKDTASIAGNDVYLTIDSELQKYCYDMLEREIAAILISKIQDVAYAPEKQKAKIVPITDVYAALFSNNQIKLSRMTRASATDLEKKVYENYTNKLSYTLDTVDSLLTDNPVELKNLEAEYRDYCEYICEMLAANGIYDSTKFSHNSKEFLDYITDQSSLQSFLHFLINEEAIDLTSIEKNDKYYDSDEMYEMLINYIIDYLETDTNFNYRVIRNMVRQGEISSHDVIMLLYDQGVLNRNADVEYDAFYRGELTPYSFIIKKIQNLEITPAMLNLTPCSGAVVVTDVNTGEVKAMVSYPSYDNNYLTNKVDPDYYDSLLEDQTNPLYNRATMMRTAPGSTFKPISAITGVSEGVLGLDEYITDLGVFEQVYTKPMCWVYRDERLTHGSIGLSTALDVSCNYFFFTVGYRLATRSGKYLDDEGLVSLKKYAAMFGLTSKSGIEIEEIEPKFSDNDAVTSAIGQGRHNFSPVQLSRYVTTIANSGTCYNLSLMNRITDYEGNVVRSSSHTIASQVNIDDSLWNAVHTGMRWVVTDDLAKNRLLNSINVQVAGKTGTAQEGEDRPAHALFISYAPYTHPEVSVTTVIPNGYSSKNAADLTGFIYAYMYDKEALNDATFTDDNGEVGD